jgi:MFS transporter, DHA1 family, inner membrane transport protein
MDRRLFALALGMFAIGTDSFVVAGILSLVSLTPNVSVALAGQMVTVYAISYALLSPLVAAAAAHCGWGLLVPQQHRLLFTAPEIGPLLMGLNSAAIYTGVSMSGVLGALGITYLNKYDLGLFGAVFIATALVMAELAHRRIVRRTTIGPDAVQSL